MRSHCCVCLLTPPPALLGNGSGKNPAIVARQRLGRNGTAVMNTHATIEELLDAACSMWPVSYQGNKAISSSRNFLFFRRHSVAQTPSGGPSGS
jgi:hypothetical protein